MKYIFKYIVRPLFSCLVTVPLIMMTGAMATLAYFLWNFTLKGCPSLSWDFYDYESTDWGGRRYKYNTFSDFLTGKKNYLD